MRRVGMSGRVLGLVLSAILAWAWLPGVAEAEAQAPRDTPEVLRPGDMIRVQVWRQPDLSGTFEVSESGVLAHPLYRRVMAAGRPLRDVEEDILAFLRTYESNPAFIVEGMFRVAVGGEVRQPDVHLLRPGTTVAEAVAMTGGISDRGRLDRVILRRGDEEFRLDLTDPRARLRQVTVRSGDEIVVERRSSVFRDHVGPAASVIAALAALARLFVD
jgi:protein involved in polysaccharide export with SLBB domain